MTQDLARERKARLEAEAVLADTTRARARFGIRLCAVALTPAALGFPRTRHTLRCGSTRPLFFPSRASCRRLCRRCGTKSRRRTLSSQSSSPTTGLRFGASPSRYDLAAGRVGARLLRVCTPDGRQRPSHVRGPEAEGAREGQAAGRSVGHHQGTHRGVAGGANPRRTASLLCFA